MTPGPRPMMLFLALGLSACGSVTGTDQSGELLFLEGGEEPEPPRDAGISPAPRPPDSDPGP